MKLTKLHLIIILALTLILCPILGVCNNARNSFQENMENEEGVVDDVEGFVDDVEPDKKVQEGLDDDEEEPDKKVQEGWDVAAYGVH